MPTCCVFFLQLTFVELALAFVRRLAEQRSDLHHLQFFFFFKCIFPVPGMPHSRVQCVEMREFSPIGRMFTLSNL
jgi:hypothetical protein